MQTNKQTNKHTHTLKHSMRSRWNRRTRNPGQDTYTYKHFFCPSQIGMRLEFVTLKTRLGESGAPKLGAQDRRLLTMPHATRIPTHPHTYYPPIHPLPHMPRPIEHVPLSITHKKRQMPTPSNWTSEPIWNPQSIKMWIRMQPGITMNLHRNYWIDVLCVMSNYPHHLYSI